MIKKRENCSGRISRFFIWNKEAHMDIKKLNPWNWFKKEEETSNGIVPVKRTDDRQAYPEVNYRHPLAHLHREMDRLFEDTFRGFGLSPFRSDLLSSRETGGFLKPQVDVGATDREYTISVEVPGVDEKDVKVEIADNTLTIRGEKKHEQEEKEKNYYRMERSYGSFQRVLTLPGDADQEKIKANFKKGVLTVTLPRKSLPKADVKNIEIKSTD